MSAGVMLVGRRDVEMDGREIATLIEIEDVLRKLDLSLFCLRCHSAGLNDGVRCQNHPTDHTWTVECGCSVRTYRRLKPPSP